MKIQSQLSVEKVVGKADLDCPEIKVDTQSAAFNVDCKVPLSWDDGELSDSDSDSADMSRCSSPYPKCDKDDEEEDVSELSAEKPWSELTCKERIIQVFLIWLLKPLVVTTLLFIFICSLDLLSSAFRLLGGKAAGEAFSSNVLMQNPVAGLMIGILSTVLVQSSSTSTSIVVTMVASGILEVRPAIPIVMGANIGTSVTNTIVSLAQSSDRGQFELAFAGATVHDMFNWLAVLVFLPLEVASGYLYFLTGAIVDNVNLETTEMKKHDMLKALTKPVTSQIVQLDKKVIEKIALGHEEYLNKSLLKEWCGYETMLVPLQPINATENGTQLDITSNETIYELVKKPIEQCSYLFHDTGLSDTLVGIILLAVSLTILCTCLVMIVKVLNSALKGKLAGAAQRLINKDLPGRCGYFTGYLALVAGAGMTILVQSSSVFTSTLTPLVGMGVISLERMYPLTLGSNIGTTTTGLLAAMAASGDKLRPALQIALVHLFFNISGILLFFPVPYMRWPIGLARLMGRTTAKYRWFAILYLVLMFFILPSSLFALSMTGTIIFFTVLSVVCGFFIFLGVLNVLKKRYRERLSPRGRRVVDSFPRCFYSLEPLDAKIQWLCAKVKAAAGWVRRTCCPCIPRRSAGCCCRRGRCKEDEEAKPGGHPHEEADLALNDSNTPMLLMGSKDSSQNSSLLAADEGLGGEEPPPKGSGDQTEGLVTQVQSIFRAVDGALPTPVIHVGDSAYASKDNSPNLSKYPSTEKVSPV